MAPLTCDAAGSLIARAADGSLAAPERARLETHLQACEACRRELEGQESVSLLLGACGTARLPAGFQARLETRLARERSWFGAADWRWWTVRTSPAAAALFVLILVTSPRQEGGLPASFAAGADQEETPVYGVLWEPQISDESLLRIVLTAHPDASLEEYLGGNNGR
jgi:anti-sigma factor RsiW